MNRFLLFAVILSAIVLCCLGRGHHGWEDNPDMVKIKAKLCDKVSKPTEEQWNAYLDCNKPSNETKPGDHHHHGGHHEKMKAAFEECANKTDDVTELKTNNAERDKYIIMFCSEKNKVCLKEMREQWKKNREEKKSESKSDSGDQEKSDGGDQSNSDRGDHPKPDWEAMKKKWEEKITCAKTALGLN